MKNTKRLFIAVKPPENVVESLKRIIGFYKKESWGKDVRWVKSDNLHLTLKFIGQIEKNRIRDILSAVETSLKGLSSFHLESEGLKIFPKPSKPHIISVGVAEQPELIHLAAAIEDGLQKCGIQKERKPFKGHITIGRCKKSFPKCRKIETFSGSFRFSVNEVILYSSVLKPEGTEYRLEKKIRFA